MALSKETLDQLTAEFKSPQELQLAYSHMLQHMINRAAGRRDAGASGP